MKYFDVKGKEISRSSFFSKLSMLKKSASEYSVYYFSGLSGDGNKYKRLLHEK